MSETVCEHCGQPAEDDEDIMHRGCRLKAAFAEDAKEVGDGLISLDMVAIRQKMGFVDPCPDCRVDLSSWEQGRKKVVECQVNLCRLHAASPELLDVAEYTLAALTTGMIVLNVDPEREPEQLKAYVVFVGKLEGAIARAGGKQ